MSSEADHRLPRSVTPKHYALTLEPELEAATFSGSVAVDVVVAAPTAEIVLNAAELEINDVEVVSADGRRLEATTELDALLERLIVRPETRVDVGDWQLRIGFTGVLNEQLRGFYRSVYRDVAGTEHVLATTQFEATDARRAFPCWDEPDAKATFDVTLVVPEHHLAVSCAPVAAEEPVGEGKRRVRFATTMPLPTYLLAFVVGELEATAPVDVSGVPLRIVHPPGKGHLAGFALEFGAFALDFFAGYYGIPYPGEKLDLIAIPDFASGAMENLGAVTFRESLLLIDPEKATHDELERVADVIAHELAHMWFGDLVTMRWWNGLWLKEAFATFMEMVCVDEYRPEWRRWATFAAERDRSMDTDGLRSTRPIEFAVASPSDADAMYDVITYSKGAAVLRMLQQYLGEEPFRRGINRYLRTHAYGNTETHDLWDALEDETGEPVRNVMESWIFQGGHPEVVATRALDGYMLRQQRFVFSGPGDERWRVPVLYRTGAGDGKAILDDELTLLERDPLFVNRGGHGYYRTRYGGELSDTIGRAVRGLVAEERFVVIADAWASTLAGTTPAADFLELIGAMHDERDVVVWGAMLGGLRELNHVVSSDERPALEGFVRALATPAGDELGWAPEPHEPALRRKLRGEVLAALGILGRDPGTIAEARRIVPAALAGTGGLDGDVAAAAIGVVAANGSMTDHATFASAFAAAGSPQDELRYLAAMTAIPEPAAADTTMAMVLDGRIRSQHAMSVIARLLANRVVGPIAWQATKEHWDALVSIMPPFNARTAVATVHLRSEPEIADDIAAWLPTHPLPGGDTLVAQQLERLQVRVGLRRRSEDLRIPSL